MSKSGSAQLTTPSSQIPLHPVQDKIYTRSFKGFYRNLRLAGGTILFLLFFGTAWINLNGRQAVLFDLSARKFHIFGATFWPQDFILLSWLLIICAFGLFAITVFAGRIWCGYTCPQSVFTWVYMWAEKITEGQRNQRIKRDKGPLNKEKLLRKVAKHSLWLLIAFVTALTFVGYFTPVRGLIPDLIALEVSTWGAFWLLFFTLATYINAGWTREMVCLHMCPYARFQSVMFDNDTLVVAYDKSRGESRGSRKRNTDPKAQGLGDCIDCKACVQVCPTGIDIRNGLQYQCIGCAACVDACNGIMDKMGYKKGLIRYTTETELSGGKKHLLRPRLFGYGAVLLVITGLFMWSLNTRPLLEMDVIRDRSTLYRTTADNRIENIYVIKISNKSHARQALSLKATGIRDLTISQNTRITVNPGEIIDHIIKVQASKGAAAPGSQAITFTLQPLDPALPAVVTESRFMMPFTP